MRATPESEAHLVRILMAFLQQHGTAVGGDPHDFGIVFEILVHVLRCALPKAKGIPQLTPEPSIA